MAYLPWLPWGRQASGKPPEWSLSSIVADSIAAAADGQWSCHTEHPWLYVMPADDKTPDQGWKLHVAGTLLSARDILTRALPILLAEKSQFKLAADLDFLEWLSSQNAE